MFAYTLGNMIKNWSGQGMANLEYTLDGSEEVTLRKDGTTVRVPVRLLTPYADARNPRPFVGGVRWPGRKTFSLFEEDEGTWQSVGAGSRSFETVSPYYGAGFQRITTNGAGGTSIVRITQLPLTYNATGKSIGITMKIDDLSKISGIRLDIGSSNLANRFTWNNILGSQAVRTLQDGRFIDYTFPLGNPDVEAGSPNIASIDCFQLRITDTAESAAVVDLERIFFFDNTPAASCVTMDDSYRSWYSLGKPILDRYDILTTLYTIQRYVDPDHPNYDDVGGTRLTEAMIAEMVEQGHELAYHEVGNDLKASSPEGVAWTRETLAASIDRFKAWAWNTFGVEVTTAAYPGGETGEFVADPGHTVRDVFAEHFAVARTINRATPDTVPTGDRSLTRCYGYVFGNGAEKMTIYDAAARLAEITASGGVISWSFHELVSGVVGESDPNTQFNIDEFEAIMSAIRDEGVRIATVQEIYSAITTQ